MVVQEVESAVVVLPAPLLLVLPREAEQVVRSITQPVPAAQSVLAGRSLIAACGAEAGFGNRCGNSRRWCLRWCRRLDLSNWHGSLELGPEQEQV